MPLSNDPDELQAAIDGLGDAGADDKHRAFERRQLTRRLERVSAARREREVLAERAKTMTPAELAEFAPRCS